MKYDRIDAPEPPPKTPSFPRLMKGMDGGVWLMLERTNGIRMGYKWSGGVLEVNTAGVFVDYHGSITLSNDD